MPLHHMLKALAYTVILGVILAATALFYRGVSDSPYPTPTPSNLGQLETL